MDLTKLNAKTILEKPTFDEILAVDSEFERNCLLESVAEQAKIWNVKSKFLAMYKAAEKDKKNADREQKQKEAKERAEKLKQYRSVAMTQFNHNEYPDLLCGAWECDYSGVKFQSERGIAVACYHPIMPVKRLVNVHTGKEKMTIAFERSGKWHEQTFDKSTLLSASKVVNAMTDYGVLLSSENAKHIVRYFAEIEAMNMHTLPITRSTSKMGWIDGFFMPYGGDVAFDSESRFKALFDSISMHGNKERYMQFIKGIRKSERIEPRLVIAVSLASVLVDMCGVLPFIFHLYGIGGKGKTVCMMLAASLWGNPNEGEYIADPKSTKTAFEMRLDFLNNLPFICDDMGQVKKHLSAQKNGDFSDFIYLVCSGKGNERSNVDLGVNKTTTWRNCSITSSEKPITSEVSQGGELLRVIDYEVDDGNIFKDGKGVADFVRSNYGFLGYEFILAVKSLGAEKIKEMHKEMIDRLNAMDNLKIKEGKQIIPTALYLVADKIFTDYVIKDNVYLDIEKCFNLIKSNDQMNDNERAYDYICNEVNIHYKKFAVTDVEPVERWGYFEGDFVLINPNVFSRIADDVNFNKKMFVEWGIKNGICEASEGRLTKKFRKYGGARYIVVKIKNEDKNIDEL